MSIVHKQRDTSWENILSGLNFANVPADYIKSAVIQLSDSTKISLDIETFTQVIRDKEPKTDHAKMVYGHIINDARAEIDLSIDLVKFKKDIDAAAAELLRDIRNAP